MLCIPNLRHRLLKIVLKQGVGMQLLENCISQNSPSINIRWEMFADQHPVPTDIATNSQNGLFLFWKQFRNDKRIHRSSR